MPGINLKLADEFAPDYDNLVLKNNWSGPEILFKSVKGSLKAHSKILDLGIGTGESSIRFKNAGHYITGLDGSEKMLQQCKRKNAADNLVCHDLENPLLPFQNNTFDAIISNGVFHLIYPLSLVFSEAKRLLKSEGLFVFTYEDASETSGYKNTDPGVWKMKTTSEVITFKYSNEYISGLLNKNNFNPLSGTRFLAFTNRQLQKDFYFTLVVAQQIRFQEL